MFRGELMQSKRSFAPRLIVGVVALCLLSLAAQIDARQSSPLNVGDRYVKSEHRITMRDGVKLYTVVYSPKDASQKYPILMTRTPYSAGPYGADDYRPSLGPSAALCGKATSSFIRTCAGRSCPKANSRTSARTSRTKRRPKILTNRATLTTPSNGWSKTFRTTTGA